jgi:hypothetical protein
MQSGSTKVGPSVLAPAPVTGYVLNDTWDPNFVLASSDMITAENLAAHVLGALPSPRGEFSPPTPTPTPTPHPPVKPYVLLHEPVNALTCTIHQWSCLVWGPAFLLPVPRGIQVMWEAGRPWRRHLLWWWGPPPQPVRILLSSTTPYWWVAGAACWVQHHVCVCVCPRARAR